MLDSVEEAMKLCFIHGFSGANHGSAAVVLLVKASG